MDALQELAAARFALAMEDVAERGDLVATAQVCLKNVPGDIFELRVDAVALGYAARDGNHIRPIDRGHADLRALLGEGDAPHARAGGDVEHADVAVVHREQRVGGGRCFVEAHGEKVLH